MEVGQIHHVEYYVDNLKKSREFWDWFLESLEYKLYQEFSSGVSWSHKNGTYLVFVQVEEKFKNIQNNRQGNGLNHIAFVGKSTSYLDKIQELLADKGASLLKRDEKHLCFECPNGFAVEIFI